MMQTDRKLLLEPQANRGELSRRLAASLKKNLAASGRIGQRILSNREIAAAAGVSQVTARMAVAQLQREGVLEVRPGIGTFVRALPGPLAVRQSNSLKRIGLVLSPWDRESIISYDRVKVFIDLMEAVNSTGYQLLIFPYLRWLEYADKSPEAMVTDNELDMLIWFHVGPVESSFVTALHQQHFPQLIFFRRQFGVNTAAVCHDEEGLMRDLAGRLTPEERENPLIITGPTMVSPYFERMRILRRELAVHGVSLNPDQILQLPEDPYPDWAPQVITGAIERNRPVVLIDLVGYVSILHRFWRTLKYRPRVISVTDVELPDRDFHYSGYRKNHSYSIAGIIRNFLHERFDFKDVILGFRRHER
ncbi:GntR family transcriptional regulator [uncultured Victivallis sp.]|uniref:GntR family transcriptional regulator n=1 Tax=uncultured Victivallis sp. TaxID=354118 RepID=UPI0025E7FDA1|nr:GntR family transcriptional regulator [uncultured Victivallis sp.]